MNKRSLGALAALNIALLAALAVVNFTPRPAAAQSFSRAQYTMVSGTVTGRAEQVIYVVDTNTGNLVALLFNGGNKVIEKIDSRSITADLASAGGRR